MAKFDGGFDVLEGLRLSIEDAAKLDGEALFNILEAGALVIVAAQRRILDSLDLVITGRLRDSLRMIRKGSGPGSFILVYPHGEHHKVKSGRSVANNEVGYVLELGAPHRNIKAYSWMAKGNEDGADEMVAAQGAVWDGYLASKGL